MNDTTDAPPQPSEPPPADPGSLPPAAEATEPVIGGVCATLADRIGIDALWLRIGFVILAVSSGVGLIAYLGLWLALVAGPRRASRAMVVVGGLVLLLAVLGITPFAIALPWLLASTVLSPGALTVVLLLAGIAIALWQPRRPDLAWPPPSHATDVPAPETSPAAGSPAPGTAAEGRGWARRWRPAGIPPSPRSVLGRLTLGAALIVAATGALVDQVNGGRLHPEQWLGAAAVVCGIGLLVGVVRGHGRWLILPAVVFAAVGFLGGEMARMGTGFSDITGDRWVTPGPPGGQPAGGLDTAEARVGVGRVIVEADLVSVADATPRPLVVDARVAVGSIEVRTPGNLTILIRTRGDTPVRGYGIERVADGHRIGPPGPPDIVVDAWVGVGSVRVQEVWSPVPGFDDPPAAEVVDLGMLTPVADLVGMTGDGWFVLGDGEAVIDDEDQLVVGESWTEEGGVTVISSGYGEFRLLPRGLLVSPMGGVIDLHALRPVASSGDGLTDEEPTPTSLMEEG